MNSGLEGCAVRTWKCGALFCGGLASDYLFCAWVLPCGVRRLEPLGDDSSWGAMLGSTVDTCSASVFGYLAVTCSVSGCCSRSTKIGFFGRYVAQYFARQRIHVLLQCTWLLDEFPSISCGFGLGS